METVLLEKLLDKVAIPAYIILVILVLFFAVKYADNIKLLLSWLIYPIAFIFKRAKTQFIKYQLDGACSIALNKYKNELPDFTIPPFRIKWMKEKDYATMLKEGEAIVNLRFSPNQTQNIINATSVYVRDIFLKHTKPYISTNLQEAINLTIISSILQNTDANHDIMFDFFEENKENFVTYAAECEQLQSINDSGLFSRILIRELDSYGHKLLGRIPNDKYKQEADDFVKFLYNIAIREHEEYTKLQFEQSFLKVGVLLVAKEDTYAKGGLAPYLRRIKLGFAKGIDTFYLLAREESVDILKKVVQELLLRGDFRIINKPKEYKDRYDRDVICYCIKVDSQSSIANAYRDINDTIKTQTEIVGVITRVRKDKICVDVNGVEGYVAAHNFSKQPSINPFDYFKENSLINIIPMEVKDDGIVEFSLIGTNSDPIRLLQNNFTIGTTIEVIVDYADDDFVKFNIPDVDTTAIAFRRDLTYSRYMLLHQKFTNGSSWNCDIKEINYEKNELIVRLHDLIDPWKVIDIYNIKKSMVNFTICRRDKFGFWGEIKEGIVAFLPYKNLAWLEKDIEQTKRTLSLGSICQCHIIDVNLTKKLIYLSCKNNLDNPYESFVKQHKNVCVSCILRDKSEKGYFGQIANGLKIFIPKEETHRDNNYYDIKLNTYINVFIIGLGKSSDLLIGSVKKYIPYALQEFYDTHQVNQIIDSKDLVIKEITQECIIVMINKYKALLFRGDISNEAYIPDCRAIFSSGKIDFPLVIKDINLEQNRILLSLRNLTMENSRMIKKISYQEQYDAIVLGYKQDNRYTILLKTIWIETTLESAKALHVGETIIVRAVRLTEPSVFILVE